VAGDVAATHRSQREALSTVDFWQLGSATVCAEARRVAANTVHAARSSIAVVRTCLTPTLRMAL
jgi:hypothetical protein